MINFAKKKSLVFSDFSSKGESTYGGENDEGENVLLDTLSDPEPPPNEIIVEFERKQEIDTLLNKLPVLYREVLILRYKEHFTFNEIGLILNKPLDTVKSQHRRGLILLRKMINKE